MSASLKSQEAALPPRTTALLARIRSGGGEWTTRRVQQAYRADGFDAPQRQTARRDLELLTRAGYLIRHDQDSLRRFYTLDPAKGGA
ncbi:hypothetical protein [Streptomyces abikoensis]|uniref:hypothetical protein n=1 Tax=Streptomyces abikoensis TaxID=97398 RepID=UPI0016795805|nr:hypothetical protein [Streptomyces abikoensis]GGP55536.1 hypothetical protein GCM10010214_30910 [Streptomyces abikoensis]